MASVRSRVGSGAVVTVDGIRTVAWSLPRTEEALVRRSGQLRVGRIVYVALSRDELWMGLRLSEGRARGTGRHRSSKKFFMPIPSDLRYNWVRVWLQAIDQTEIGSSSSTRGAWSCRSELPPTI